MNPAPSPRPGSSSGRPTDGPTDREDAVRRARPALRVAAAVLWLEAVAVLLYGILVLINMNKESVGVGIGVGCTLVAWGVALALVGRGLALVRQWSRGPAVALQLLHLPIAYGFRHSIGWLSLAMFVTAVFVLVAVFLPASTAAFTLGRRLPGQDESDEETGGETGGRGGGAPGRGGRR